MNDADRRILIALQKDGQISMARLSEQVGLSLSACHRRVKLLEASGLISGYVAKLDRRALGFEIQVFIEVKLVSLRPDDTRAFENAIRQMPEVLECHMISGDFDYLMRIAAANTEAYEKLFRERLALIPSVSQMKTLLNFATIKEFAGYHLEL